ncbi:MAG: DPP IV N-terminal domain-containing protein, partial [Planctomycetales bacterium]
MKKNHPMLSKSRLLFGLAALTVAVGLGQTPDARGAVYKTRINPQWSPDNSHFWYRNDLAKGQREFILVDVEKGVRKQAFDHRRLAKSLADAGVRDAQPERLRLDQLQFDLAKNTVTFRAGGKNFRCDLATYQLMKLEKPSEKPKTPPVRDASKKPKDKAPEKRYRPSRGVSPDGKWRAFTRDHNVFVVATTGGEEIQLSKDGKPDRAYQAPYWAANSNNLIAFRVEPGDAGEVYLIESSPREGGRAKLRKRRYPLPGDKFTTHELNWFDVAKRLQRKPEVGLIDFGGPNLRWTPDGQYVRYQKIDRGHQRLRVIEVDVFTGSVRNIIDEVAETFIWTQHYQDLGVSKVTWLDKTNEIAYLSERDGWRHLYLVDVAAGTTKHQITKGEFVVRRVDRIDEEKRQVWFRASGRNKDQDPYLIHYYRVNFDGTGLIALTEGNGDHSISYSPDGKYIIDTYSRVDMAPVHELRRVSDGSLVCELEQSDVGELKASGWEPPEVFTAKGRDGKTDIWGIICRPRDFDPGKKYPVLEDM